MKLHAVRNYGRVGNSADSFGVHRSSLPKRFVIKSFLAKGTDVSDTALPGD
ncbi:hypothetical protein IscW_ISCW006278 [Ixodes scapularis]|uniref:Uncharacterized protein n=1 Tax=Ixodes scapularis TaxID=6945 RepID=B7PQD5_IXOSC|nr:hypothetical protein IscW_ISCW006278 [Ixodes scapularis]|eukprot:XP_002435977.1 hypothetical protein IscW_ISCW006278 [Ixodes scapularis]